MIISSATCSDLYWLCS